MITELKSEEKEERKVKRYTDISDVPEKELEKWASKVLNHLEEQAKLDRDQGDKKKKAYIFGPDWERFHPEKSDDDNGMNVVLAYSLIDAFIKSAGSSSAGISAPYIEEYIDNSLEDYLGGDSQQHNYYLPKFKERTDEEFNHLIKYVVKRIEELSNNSCYGFRQATFLEKK
jgi:hypothetical protein